MRFLADESCDFAVVRALRAAGHDVTAIVEQAPGTSDHDVIALAVAQTRVVITEDKDFGQMVFATGQGAAAVVFLRYAASARAALADHVVQTVANLGESLSGCFVTVAPGRIRVAKLPT